MSKTERNIRRGIFLIVLALLLILLCGAVRPRCEPATESYFVKPGDTLWSIAQEFKQPGQDTRKYIDEIKRINGISALIREGQEIKIIK